MGHDSERWITAFSLRHSLSFRIPHSRSCHRIFPVFAQTVGIIAGAHRLCQARINIIRPGHPGPAAASRPALYQCGKPHSNNGTAPERRSVTLSHLQTLQPRSIRAAAARSFALQVSLAASNRSRLLARLFLTMTSATFRHVPALELLCATNESATHSIRGSSTGKTPESSDCFQEGASADPGDDRAPRGALS